MKDQRTYKIIWAAMEVHRELGCGFLEPVYQETLAKEFDSQNIEDERLRRLEAEMKRKGGRKLPDRR